METFYDQNLIPRLLLTLIAIALCIGPMKADFNKTHATNPLWPGHARFHVVWQVLTNSAMCLVLLYLIWVQVVSYQFQLHLVATVMAIILGSFFVTLAASKLFGGTLKDKNGIPPFKFKFPGRTVKVDTNLFGFSIIVMVLLFTLNSIQY